MSGKKAAVRIGDLKDYPIPISDPLRKTLIQCIECGKCVGTCTAARVSERFNPRKIVRRVVDGDGSIISDPVIWECFLCHYCRMICPRMDMDLPELIFALREASLKMGTAPSGLTGLTPWYDKFYECGKIAGPNNVGPERIKELAELRKKLNMDSFKKSVESLGR